MTELIQELLLSHNCVIIPGFGAFIGNYSPSEIRLADNLIFPPRKVILFNRALQTNDGLLVNAMAYKLQVPYKEAEQEVAAFSKSCNETLANVKSLILKDLGRFILDGEQVIQFQPLNNQNYLLDSFGLEPLSVYPIQRLKDEAEAIKENYQRVLHPEYLQGLDVPVSRTSRIPYWIMSVLAFAFIGSTLIFNIKRNNEAVNYTSLLPVSTAPVSTENMSKGVIATATIATVEDSTIALNEDTQLNDNKEVVSFNSSLVTTPVKKSYIVVGAFFDEAHANKVKAEVEARGYVTMLTKEYNDVLYRVSVEVETPFASATLGKIKADFNQRAWISCTDCTLN